MLVVWLCQCLSKEKMQPTGKRLLHVVVALNSAEDEAIVITAYWPDDVVWLPGYRSRKK